MPVEMLAVAVQVLVSPQLGALVEQRTGAVAVVPVRQEDGGDLDLVADRALERCSHLGGCPRGVSGVDDDPAVRGFDRETARNAPAAQRIHAVGDTLGALPCRRCPTFRSRAARCAVVIAPFGPTTVSSTSEGLRQDGGDCAAARSVDWARAASDGANAVDAQARINRTRLVMAGPSGFSTRNATPRDFRAAR